VTDLPERIGRYVVERVLGSGAMGVIYKAHDPEIDRDVAVKLIRADLLGGEERDDYIARFRREAMAAGRCIHPNIVALFDSAVYEGNPFLVMEYVDGTSLAQMRASGTRLPVQQSCDIVGQLLDALTAAHDLGVVHRDVKPANILLRSDGRVKVTDFGISRVGMATLSQGAAIVGTPSYMSPEHCRGDAVDARSDLFSVGVVLFELLVGERPFPGPSLTAVMAQVLHAPAPDLQGRVPAALAEVVRRALAKSADDRFPSAAAMAVALRAATQRGADDEATIVAGQPAVSAVPSGTMDHGVLDSLQTRLARDIGPIAKMLVGTAALRAPNFEQLCQTLAQNIDDPAQRRAFLRDMRAGPEDHGTASHQAPGVRPAVAELAQAELSRAVGPIARVLVKRALASSHSTAEFWRTLAGHIENATERAAFMRRQPPG
jgi:serine/threonine-protein kinase